MKVIALLTAVLSFFLSPFALATELPCVAAKPIVAAYFGIWGDNWGQRLRPNTPFDKLTRIYIAFGKIVQNPDGHFTIAFDGDAARAQQVIAQVKAVNPTAEIFLTVGGNDAETSFGGAAHDAAFANNVVNFLNQYDFNGFDIDWEQQLNKTDIDSLITELSAVLHTHNLKLTFDVSAGVSPSYDLKLFAANLDQINLMTYGTTDGLSLAAGIYNMFGFPMNKMIGGVEVETGYKQATSLTDTLGPNGTIAQKSSYALKNGMAGMMAWRMDNDYAAQATPDYPTYQGLQELWQDMQP